MIFVSMVHNWNLE